MAASDTDKLWRAILELQSISEARRFFRDLLTKKEILEFSKRWKVAQMLARATSYKEIERLTGMSSTTIARVQRWLTRGASGYQVILRRMGKRSS